MQWSTGVLQDPVMSVLVTTSKENNFDQPHLLYVGYGQMWNRLETFKHIGQQYSVYQSGVKLLFKLIIVDVRPATLLVSIPPHCSPDIFVRSWWRPKQSSKENNNCRFVRLPETWLQISVAAFAACVNSQEFANTLAILALTGHTDFVKFWPQMAKTQQQKIYHYRPA